MGSSGKMWCPKDTFSTVRSVESALGIMGQRRANSETDLILADTELTRYHNNPLGKASSRGWGREGPKKILQCGVDLSSHQSEAHITFRSQSNGRCT